MKTRRSFFAAHLALLLAFAALAPLANARAQAYGALERGYRTGYSDGYQAGWGDQLRRAPSDFSSKSDYRQADRAYIAAYGSIEDYRDGYRQGFEVGYEAGYNRRGFDSSIPAGGVTRRGATADAGESGNDTGPGARRSNDDDDGSSSSSSDSAAPGTVMLVELVNRVSTDVSQRGDRFEARVIEPREYEGAIVGGRLTEVQRSGKVRGRSRLQLDFDKIKMAGGDWSDFNAQVIEIVPVGEETAGEVDPEGGVRGKSTTKEDAIKVGAGAGIGAIIGGIAGGGKGAGIGAIIGGSVGAAGAMSQRGEEIRLERGQRLRIRTTGRSR